eukprot:365243-Chlamydomonas_euryale.AAC.8
MLPSGSPQSRCREGPCWSSLLLASLFPPNLCPLSHARLTLCGCVCFRSGCVQPFMRHVAVKLRTFGMCTCVLASAPASHPRAVESGATTALNGHRACKLIVSLFCRLASFRSYTARMRPCDGKHDFQGTFVSVASRCARGRHQTWS